MANLRNSRELATVSKETQERPRNSQSQNTSVPGITENSIKQASEKTEGRINEKLSQEFSCTEFRILSALSKLDELLLKPRVRTLSGTVPGISRNNDTENWETARDNSQSDPYPKVEFSVCRYNNSVDSDPKDTSHNYRKQMGEISWSSYFLRVTRSTAYSNIRGACSEIFPTVALRNVIKMWKAKKNRACHQPAGALSISLSEVDKNAYIRTPLTRKPTFMNTK